MLINNLISLLYFIIIISFLIAALFIFYHIVKYSINKTHSLIMLSLFSVVFIILILLNIYLFFHLNLDFTNNFSSFSHF